MLLKIKHRGRAETKKRGDALDKTSPRECVWPGWDQ